MAPEPKYAIGSAVICQYKGMPYEAKVIDIKDPESDDPAYVIHYHGWNSRYNEEVRFSKSSEKLSEVSEDLITAARAAMVNNKKRKSKVDHLTDDDARLSETGSRGSSPSTSIIKAKITKKRPDSSQNSSPDYSIIMLKNLKQIMVDDHDLINKNYLSQLPARHTVESIIQDYLKSIDSDIPNADKLCDVLVENDDGSCSSISNIGLVGSTKGVMDYFDALLEPKCLYKFERIQYHDFKNKMIGEMEKGTKKAKKGQKNEQSIVNFQPSKYYGIIHLLRLFKTIPSILKMTPISEHLHKEIYRGLNDIVMFLNKNHEKYFNVSEDYYIADQEYCRAAFQP